ncbi:MAG: multidrug efflux SMR transporter [Gammaproteobacteria bacterium]|nr:multidrug efflux SMR transporter [Gammaproteobacteria bacterium]
MHWLYLALAIVAEVVATSALKAAEGFTRPWPALFVVLGYGVAFYFLSLTLKVVPVGVAYAIWSGVGTALIAVIGWVLFGQTLDVAALIGLALIVAGVAVLQVFSRSLGG